MSLERELRALDPAWPATPDVAAAIADRLAPRATRPRWRAVAARPASRVALAALAVLVVLAGAGAAVPAVRAELKELLGFAGGERVERVQPVPPAERRLDLGAPTTLAAARRRAGFAVAVPARLGAPNGVRIGGDLGPRAVTLLYGSGTALTQSPGRSSIGVVKQIGRGVELRQVRLGSGRYGFWIAAGPRGLLVPVAPGSRVRRRTALPGAGLLLWDADGVAYRLETRRGLDAALAVARSVPR